MHTHTNLLDRRRHHGRRASPLLRPAHPTVHSHGLGSLANAPVLCRLGALRRNDRRRARLARALALLAHPPPAAKEA